MVTSTTRIINDADSHTMETGDWLAPFLEGELKDRFGALYAADPKGRIDSIIARAKARKADPQADRAAADNPIAGEKGWGAFGAFDSSERSRMLDRYGIASQLVFSTACLGPMARVNTPEEKYAVVRAANRAQQAFCDGDRRLAAVAYVPLDVPELAQVEARRAIDAGAGAISFAPTPAGDRSPGHPDHDPFWRLLCERKIPFMLHIGTGTKVQPKGYHNNGRPRAPDLHGGGENLRFSDYPCLWYAPQEFLTAMVYDGVFMRFPALRGGVIESGAGWVPDFLRQLDIAMASFRRTDPYLQALDMAPSEYLRRAVKFTPFPGEDAGRMIRDAGPELFLFSSDYPHPEGTKDPIGKFDRSLAEISADAQEMFFRTNYEAMMQTASVPEPAT